MKRGKHECVCGGERTGDDLQVNGAAVGASRVTGSADIFP